MNHSTYLDLPLRSLRDLYDEVDAQIRTKEQQQAALLEALTDQELHRSFGGEANKLARAWNRLDAEICALVDRLDEIEEELAWAERGEERRDNPMVL